MHMKNSNLNRRQLMKMLGLGSAGSLLGSAVPDFGQSEWGRGPEPIREP
jgi:hypothetical protein